MNKVSTIREPVPGVFFAVCPCGHEGSLTTEPSWALDQAIRFERWFKRSEGKCHE